MSDSDGYSASSGYLYFSEKSGTPVERKTVKSDTFSAIVELNVFTPVDQLFANRSFARKFGAVLVTGSLNRPLKSSAVALEMFSDILFLRQFPVNDGESRLILLAFLADPIERRNWLMSLVRTNR